MRLVHRPSVQLRLSGGLPIYQPTSSILCLCVSGQSTAAVQINLHHGRAGAQRERRSRTVSSSRDVGEPIAFEHNPTHDRLSAFRLPSFKQTLQLNISLFYFIFFFFCNHTVLFLIGIDCFPGITLMLSQWTCVCFCFKRVVCLGLVCFICGCFKTKPVILFFNRQCYEGWKHQMHICSFGVLEFFL